MKRISVIYLLIAFLSSCSQGPQSIEEYKRWFNEENGFVKEKFINGLKIKVQFRPVELMILNEIDSKAEYSQSSLDSMIETYGQSLYYILEIGFDEREQAKEGDLVKKFSQTYTEFSEKINYLSFDLERQTRLVIGNDTIAPSIYHYERGYELQHKQTFVFAFPVKESSEKKDMTFMLNDEIFNTGLNMFKFNKDRKEIPSLPIKVKA